MAQVVECLFSKLKALSSNPYTTGKKAFKFKKKKRKTTIMRYRQIDRQIDR
jgi:hypothetical protein